MDIGANIKHFRGARQPEQRSASFDYCFNYFQSFREDGAITDIVTAGNMVLSCLHLGFYLGSWGMFRGPSGLRRRSLKQFEPVMELIARTPDAVWEADAHCYSETACRMLVGTANDIKEALHYPKGTQPTSTLATKIMLGVFGNVPAFDTRVRAGLRKTSHTQKFGVRALRGIGQFYDDHREVIEQHREHTINFTTGQPSHRHYTRAKVIDEIFYTEGRGDVRGGI